MGSTNTKGMLDGSAFIKKLQEAEVIPKDLLIRKLTLVAEPSSMVTIVYETYLDGVITEYILEQLIDNRDKLVARKVSERMKP